MGKLIDLTGQRFNRLVVISIAPKGKSGEIRWHCECDCGNKTIVSAQHLKSGHTKSCGCYHNEMAKNKDIKHRKHGFVGSRLYRIWVCMKTRCYNTNDEHYSNYGARGITICDEWLHSFPAFAEWSITNGYADNLTIDRKDNNKGYSPDNCRWATAKEQTNNRRNTQLLEFNGEVKTLKEWSETTGIKYQTLIYRKKAGKSPAEILKI